MLTLRICVSLQVVHQSYEAEADNEYVIKGNSAIMKCEIPSFVADFVSVAHWVDSSGNMYYPDHDYGTMTMIITFVFVKYATMLCIRDACCSHPNHYVSLILVLRPLSVQNSLKSVVEAVISQLISVVLLCVTDTYNYV